MGKLSIFCLVVAIAIVGVLVGNHYQIDRDINGWKDRAQVSSEPRDMLTWMTNVQEGMERWGMTQGHAALIFQTPSNDMSLIYHTVQQHVAQAVVLGTMNRSSPEYQTGLDNLRGSIRELNLQAGYYWDIHAGVFWWILFIAAGLGFIIFGMISLKEKQAWY